MSSHHIVLLGDSIFDNAVYVPGEAAVIDQLRSQLPDGWRATLLAVDGATIRHVPLQILSLPGDTTHLVVSAGGNDALGDAHRLDRVQSIDQLRAVVLEALAPFRAAYAAMRDRLAAHRLPTAVCTIYDQCPFEDALWRQLVPIALAGYNECIIREATARGIDVIELRELCTAQSDYAALSPIEPSARGGIKIARAIVELWVTR
jgi:hypothetical protein